MEHIYTIQQVAEELSLSATSLRNWEKELEGIINIRRTEPRRPGQEGDRYYTDADVNAFKLVQKLREDGLGFKAIRTVFERMKEAGGNFPVLASDRQSLDQSQNISELRIPDKQVGEIVKGVLQALAPFLTQAASTREALGTSEEQQNVFMNQTREILRESLKENEKNIEELKDEAKNLLQASKEEQEDFLKRFESIVKQDKENSETLLNTALNKMEEIKKSMSEEAQKIIADNKRPGLLSRFFGK